GTGRYRIHVENAGPSDAVGVIVTETLPAGLTYAGGLTMATGDNWDCEVNAGDAQTVDCTLLSDATVLADEAATWFEFDVDVDPSVTGDVTNVAVASSTTPDPDYTGTEACDATNNCDDITTTATVETDLEIDKSRIDA